MDKAKILELANSYQKEIKELASHYAITQSVTIRNDISKRISELEQIREDILMPLKRTTIISKRCNKCGHTHTSLPDIALYHNDLGAFNGWYFNCACNSTLVIGITK